MIGKSSLVIYKTQPAIVTETGEKYTISYCTTPATPTGKPAQYSTQKVRDKDIIFFNKGPITSLDNLLKLQENKTKIANIKTQIYDIWELLASDEETAKSEISFIDIIELSGGNFSTEETWLFYKTLLQDICFETNQNSQNELPVFLPRTEQQIKDIATKEAEKDKEAEIRTEFINRLKHQKLQLPEDAKFMQEIEALALGKTDKSKAMKEAGFKETPEKAHSVLLTTGIWNIGKNPHPSRWGLSMQSATEHLPHPPEETDRVEVNHTAWAIDNNWSADPDDAIAYDGTYIWIHVADPASAVLPDSKIDIAARNRGATLYIPEGASRMLAEESLEDYALGLCEYCNNKKTEKKSRALSFKIKLDENGFIEESTVLKTYVHVERLTYEQADEKKESSELKPLFEIAKKNIERRTKAGAVFIDLPEVHITVENQNTATPKVSITTVIHSESSSVVREMMLLAGEAAAKFAFKNNIPFPYVSQDAPDIPKELPEGLAGQYRLRRSMRSRSVGVTPSSHAGLGIGMYSQVTSPLRRYSDLIAHQQLRAFLQKQPLLDKDTMLERISAGDAASSASIKAERKSNLHWVLVFLSQTPDWIGEGIIVELKGKQVVVLIPTLGQETILTPTKPLKLNDKIQVKAGNINIPELTVTYQEV